MQQDQIILLIVCAAAVAAAAVFVSQIFGFARRIDGKPKRGKKDSGAEGGFNL